MPTHTLLFFLAVTIVAAFNFSLLLFYFEKAKMEPTQPFPFANNKLISNTD